MKTSSQSKMRKSLWIALSDLFLDTELQDYHHSHIAKAMKDSGYSLDEINDILMLEVFPVCIGNMYSIAGEWAGFDEVWLCNTIASSNRPNWFKRLLHKRSIWIIKDDWEKVVETYRTL